ncbi:hypothetical protein BV22DRAFT_1015047 [Leucogyrophana mollusca]|uniref:Uncharacterized protein n=1 Tax=Leucogyrophana mollusca TaxID=85980 RepID=A0ACB8BE69_9AGAM|nr:hypothetical protein BV22DRAFT_1015047 [Leucogyrophana mollusca]
MERSRVEFFQTCMCGRSFSDLPGFAKHGRTCSRTKKRLSGALSKAKEVWTKQKKRRTNLDAPDLDAGPTAAPPDGLDHDDGDMSLAQRRPRRQNRQLPRRFRDVLPEPPPPLPPVATAEPSIDARRPAATQYPGLRTHIQAAGARIRRFFRTRPNTFGLSRQYYAENPPSHDPDNPETYPETPDQYPGKNPFYPYPNASSFRLGDWYWNDGVQKSQESFSRLLDVVGSPDFSCEDVRCTNWKAVNRELGRTEFDAEETDDPEWVDEDAGWKKTPVVIRVPFHSRNKVPGSEDYHTVDLYHRSLLGIIREVLENPQRDQRFHYEPYQAFWHPPHREREVRIHGEMYTSEAFLEAHQRLQNSPPEPDCDLPRVIVGLMLWSDSTHLTSFGTAKLWPLYVYFGNESKYRRCKPSCNVCAHAAYFQNIPDSFKDFVAERAGGNGPSDAFLTHCHRELFHEQWKVLLDDEFLEAYQHGIVVTCCDGIQRRFYPRIFTYAADYPEKILIATIRNLGQCPCPRCTIPMIRVSDMGRERDMLQRHLLARVDDDERRLKVKTAREIIYGNNYAVNTPKVEELLKPQSLVPTSNAFSDKLSQFGFNLFEMLVVDLLHEFELGVWKAIFIHLLRILNSLKGGTLNELDRRYRQVPTFGRDTIRRFSANSSEMKKLAARDFEDLLQCAIPVFDGLLPEPDNAKVIKFLGVLAHWHGLAKLRLHTDDTLIMLDEATVTLGQQIRAFAADVCPSYKTTELPQEAAARQRRDARQQSTSGSQTDTTPSSQVTTAKTSHPRVFNLQTYKLHALGDYPAQIRRFGTTDSYSTQLGELEHRTGKGRYTRTSRRSYLQQLARIERRQTRIRRIRENLGSTSQSSPIENMGPNVLEDHHQIGKSQNFPQSITVYSTSDDPASKNFVLKLKAHLHPRIQSQHRTDNLYLNAALSSTGPIYSEDDVAILRDVVFQKDRIYHHNICRINYTTYDVRRAQDVVNPRTDHCNIMLLSGAQDSRHPFCYARVLGIYHANVIYTGPDNLDYRPRRMEFLWVRWYEEVEGVTFSWDTSGLNTLRFIPMAEDAAFGFVDPADVLRGCHLVPAFTHGKLHPDGVAMSYYARDAHDWKFYLVNRFVDRDMLIRYHWGHGVGHTYSSSHTNSPGCAIPSPSQELPQHLDSRIQDWEVVQDSNDGLLPADYEEGTSINPDEYAGGDDAGAGFGEESGEDDNDFLDRAEMYGIDDDDGDPDWLD